jgi:hypothetical protein
MSYDVYANAITHKAQKAAQAMLQTAADADDLDVVESSAIFAGLEIGEITSSRVVCTCRRAQYEEQDDGNWDAELVVKVFAPFSDISDADDFHELCGGVFAHFFQGPATITNLSNAAIKFTAQRCTAVSQEWDFDDGVWESRLVLSVKCCGAVIA